jgi:flagellar protein FlgJ
VCVSQASFVGASIGPARRSLRDYRVPVSVSIAQAILESGWGRSALAVNDHNYFGIKCFGTPGPIAIGCRSYPTRECDARGCHPTTAQFRVYRSETDSFRDHGRFLANGRRYAAAFRYTADPARFTAEIHRAGYATDPAYTQKLLRLIAVYKLYRYDR